jgi:diguanylate cyclase (GGDEF)-like protein/PAS domain S-box-containing protein
LTLGFFLLGVWSLLLFGSKILRQDLRHFMGEQQLSVAAFAAADLDRELRERLRALESIGTSITPELLSNHQLTRAMLMDRPILLSLFNAGVVVYQSDGVAIVDTEPDTGRVGVNYMDAETVAKVLRQGQANVGGPVVGSKWGFPVFAITVPLLGPDGRVIGAMSGVTNLGAANFLDKLTGNRYGKSGGYLLVAPAQRLIVTATDKSRAMERLPPAGVSPALDRFINGYRGSEIFTNPTGVEVLAAAQNIPVVGWYVAVILPTAEAFAPIARLQQQLLWATIVLSLVAAGLIHWMLKRQLAPMWAAFDTLAALTESREFPKALPIARRDEIGKLIGAFNHLLDQLAQREGLLKQVLDTSSVAIFVVDKTGYITQANQRMADMFGCTQEELVGREYVGLVHPDERAIGRQKMLDLLASSLPSVDLDRLYWRSDGTSFWGHLTGKRLIGIDGVERGLVGVIADITARVEAEHFEQFRSHVLEMMAKGELLPTILHAIAQGVETLLPGSLCSVSLLDEQGQHMVGVAAPSLPTTYQQALQGLEVGTASVACGSAAATGQLVVVEDIMAEPSWQSYHAAAANAGLRACWAQPVLASNGGSLGVIATYHRKIYTPTAAQLVLTERAAHLASIAVERQQDHETLLASEERFRSLMENIPSLSVQGYHQDGTVVFWNQASERLYGYRASEALGAKLLDLIIPDSMRAGVAAAMRQSFVSGEAIPAAELVLQAKDGSPVPVFSSHALVRRLGRPPEMFCLDIDLSERKQAQDKLQLAANVFHFSREGILVTAADGTIIDVNQAFSRITGYAREEVLGQNPRILSSGRQGKDYYATMWRNLVANGHWYGEVWNRRKNGEIYAEMQTISAVHDAQGKLLQYVALFSDITSQKEHQQQLEHIAHFDALTGLPNRVLLADRLHQAMAQAVRRRQSLALAFLDLDAFKAINDTHGHDAGDQLLVALAARMKQTLREGDTLARIGGDEFVVILADLSDATACQPLLVRLLEAAAQPVLLEQRTLQVSASLGVTFYPQEEDMVADTLLRQADQAMYQAKLAGKNRYHIFDAEQDRTVRGHHESLEGIRRALVEQEFVLYYQPKVNMRTGQVVGVEALIRWQHPDHGLLSPVHFLPVIEDHALAIDVGEWVLNSVLDQIQVWQEAGVMLNVSVNVGARQLQGSDFVQRLRAILAAHPAVAPARLGLEVLETSALEDIERVSAVIATCGAMGVDFALDDFGTGYSSLTYLKRLPASLLKIDQSFVRDMLEDADDLAILKGVIGLANAFHRDVIAEGVETIEHGVMLLQLGCDLAQGFGIARPMQAQDVPNWLQTWRPHPSWDKLR